MIAHLPLFPILIPMMTGALLLLFKEKRHGRRAAIALISLLGQLGVALALLVLADRPGGDGIAVYALGNWRAPFGIVLVADRLAAIMLTLTATLGLSALIYALARWERAGSHFLPLLQFLLMGLNGAFLTGDLFNLFVFFEVLLAASYGLALHGSGLLRVKAGMHYIVVNLVASALFLVAAALLYALLGTLNMADMAQRIALLDAADRPLFELGALLLGIVFLVKAGAWPFNFWLPAAYSAAAAPVAGVFAILTKVGVYALLRFSVLWQEVDAPAPFEGDWLFYCGLTSIAIGTVGVLASQKLDRQACFLVITSSGTLLAAFGFPGTTLTSPAIYYLLGSVLGSAAFFMLIEMAERERDPAADFLAISLDALGLDQQTEAAEADEKPGVAIPAAMAFLGLAFFSCTLLLTGLPPFPGFVAKFALLKAAIAAPPAAPALQAWLFFAAQLLSGLGGLIALSRMGLRVFWDSPRPTPRLQWLEALPVAMLILLCLLLSFGAEVTMAYCDAAAESLHEVSNYVGAVLP